MRDHCFECSGSVSGEDYYRLCRKPDGGYGYLCAACLKLRRERILKDLGIVKISKRLLDSLHRDFVSLDDAASMTRGELLRCPGIGRKSLAEFENILAQMHRCLSEIDQSESVIWPL